MNPRLSWTITIAVSLMGYCGLAYFIINRVGG